MQIFVIEKATNTSISWATTRSSTFHTTSIPRKSTGNDASKSYNLLPRHLQNDENILWTTGIWLSRTTFSILPYNPYYHLSLHTHTKPPNQSASHLDQMSTYIYSQFFPSFRKSSLSVSIRWSKSSRKKIYGRRYLGFFAWSDPRTVMSLANLCSRISVVPRRSFASRGSNIISADV